MKFYIPYIRKRKLQPTTETFPRKNQSIDIQRFFIISLPHLRLKLPKSYTTNKNFEHTPGPTSPNRHTSTTARFKRNPNTGIWAEQRQKIRKRVFHETRQFDRLPAGELLRRSCETNRRWLGDEPARSAPKHPRKTAREIQNKSETPQIGLSWRRSLIFISRPLYVARTMLRSSFAAHLRLGFFAGTFGSFFVLVGNPLWV